MNILLIRPSIRENCPPSDFPVGLGIIAAVLRQQGHQVRVYDQNALRVSVEDMLRDLEKIGEFDVIGLGGLITIYSRLKVIVPALHERFPRAKIVVGGGVTIEPDVIFEYLPVDFCVHGEGEWTFAELCGAIERGEHDFSEISGISFIFKGELVQKLIQEKFATKDNYFSALGDASRLMLNMTGFSDDELTNLRGWAKREAWAPKWLPGWVPGYVLQGLLFWGRLGRLICEPYRWGTVVRNRLKMLLG